MYEISLKARMESISELQSTLRNAALMAELEESCLLRAELVLEELFTNSIMHGYTQCIMQELSSACIWLHFEVEQGSLNICYQDAAIAYNPLERAEDFLQSMANFSSVLDRPTGGLGCILIAELSDGSRYVFEEGRNKVFLRFCERRAGQE